jgi:hypothetical protein
MLAKAYTELMSPVHLLQHWFISKVGNVIFPAIAAGVLSHCSPLSPLHVSNKLTPSILSDIFSILTHFKILS